MAADGSIGGFSGQWGEGCKIDRKRSLLRSEGVQFDDRTGKIIKKFMLTTLTPAAAEDNARDTEKASARPAKKRKTENSSADSAKTSKYFATKVEADRQEASSSGASSVAPSGIDAELKEVILQMIDERAAGKTC